ncbi:MAG TPA: hypothetical protein VH414_07870 [Lichenihabitans sp.]|jgi:hypothetical protein|nr:hypothetical protein [Lichenihabitans sp.]
MTLPAIERARAFSEVRLAALRARIPVLVPSGASVVACGSYARREASAASDFDYFTILPANLAGAAASGVWERALKRAVAGIVGVEPAKDGAFAQVERADRMVRNIGGQHDDNQKLTRRMLFLLEGAPLSAETEARAVRGALIERYLRAGLDAGLASFLLNDVIRYYRTMAVDYEFKTREGDRPKPWGLRKVKLMFSRKLLYASGLFSVAAARDLDRQPAAARLEALFDLSPVARLEEICGRTAAASLLGCYDGFLDRLADAGLRHRLEGLTPDDHDAPEFRAIEAEGARFSLELGRLFERTFAADHPIHRAMLF